MSNLDDRELTKRENYTVLDSATETVKGAAEAVKETLIGAKEAIFGAAEEVKQSAQIEGENLPQVWSKSDRACNFQAEGLIQEAKLLQSSACAQMCSGEEELKQAQKAQAAAAVISDRANQLTEQAITKEVMGQEQLVAAGNKLMQAGAELQQQAAGFGNLTADVNIHAKTQINQETAVKTAPVQPAEFHVLQTRVGAECRPIVEHQIASEYIGAQQPPQVG